MLSVKEIQKLIPIDMRTDDILVSKIQFGGACRKILEIMAEIEPENRNHGEHFFNHYLF